MTDLLSLDFSLLETESDTIELSLQVGLGEAFSNTPSIGLLYWKVGGDQTWVSLERDVANGLFQYSETLNRYLSSGDYQVRTIRAIDNFGDEIQITNSSMQDLRFSTNTFLHNSKSDDTPPVVDSLNIGEFIFDESRQQWSIEYEIAASDSLSGLQVGHIVEFLSPSGTSLQEWRSFDQAGVIKTIRYFDKFIPEGEYILNTVRLWDNAGNYTQLGTDDWDQFGEQRVINLENPHADNITPKLSSFDFDVVYNEDINRPSIILTFQPTDEGSGYNRAYIRLLDGITNHDRWIGQSEDGTQEIRFKINLTQEFTPGEYRVGYFNLYDYAGNKAQFDANALIELGFPTAINVYFKPSAGPSTNSVQGGSTDDWVLGDNANDVLLGGSGNDVLIAWDGDDYVDGGNDDDLIIGGSGEGDDTYYGGTGADTVKYTSATAGILVDLENGVAHSLDEDAGIGSDELSEIENIVASYHSDHLIGDAANNAFYALSGDDTIDGGDGDDTAYIGTDENTLVDFDSVTIGRDGDNLLISGDDIGENVFTNVESFVFNDVTKSYASLMMIDTGTGNGVDEDNDTGNPDNTGDTPEPEVPTVDEDNDTGNPDNSGDPPEPEVPTVDEDNDTGNPDNSGDTPEPEVPGVKSIGDASDDVMDGSDGDDTIASKAGDDSISAGAGNDRIAASDGNDTVDGGSGDDMIGGGLGNDSISGGTGHDTIGSGEGDDIVDGGDGNDMVAAGRGNDTVSGGLGDDRLAGSVGEDNINGGEGEDNIGGGYNNDTIHGGTGNDTVGAGQQDDVLYGDEGDDVLNGNWGHDTIYGGDGNDTIAGGDHNDVMTGGNGADVFKFRVFNTETEDRITDFTRGEDLLEMRGSFAGLNISSHADGLQVEKNGHVIILEDVTELSGDDFNFV